MSKQTILEDDGQDLRPVEPPSIPIQVGLWTALFVYDLYLWVKLQIQIGWTMFLDWATEGYVRQLAREEAEKKRITNESLCAMFDEYIREHREDLIDYTAVGDEIDYNKLGREIDHMSLAQGIDYRELEIDLDYSKVKAELDDSAIAEFIDYGELGEQIDYSKLNDERRVTIEFQPNTSNPTE